MDDMIFQCNNQNSIYVLNSNYKSYGEFARLNLIESIGVQLGAANVDKKDLCQHPLTAKPGSRSCSTVSRTLQHKLRSLGNFNDNATETIGNPLTSSSSSPSPSTSSATCLPAAAIQKLFNCSSVVNSGGSNCNNLCSNGNSRCKERDCLTSMETEYKNCNKKKCSNVKSSLIAKKTKFLQFLEEEKWGTSNDGVEKLVPANCDRQNSENISARTRSATPLPSEFHGYSCARKSTADSTAPTSVTTRGPLNNDVKHFAEDAMESGAATGGQQCQSSNWSGSGDSNNQHRQQQQQQQQQQQKWPKSNNNSELYKEAAELLGLSCTLCDNCRCLDCQSSYFDCDDSDNYSELSSMDDYDDDVAAMNAMELVMHANYYDNVVTACCSFQQQQNQQQPRSHAGTCCMSFECNKIPSTQIDEVVCPGNAAAFVQRLWHKDNEPTWRGKQQVEGDIAHTFRRQDEKKQSPSKTKASKEGPTFFNDDRKCPTNAAVDQRKSAPNQLPPQQQKQPQKTSLSNELENCANFNELSLADTKDELSNE